MFIIIKAEGSEGARPQSLLLYIMILESCPDEGSNQIKKISSGNEAPVYSW